MYIPIIPYFWNDVPFSRDMQEAVPYLEVRIPYQVTYNKHLFYSLSQTQHETDDIGRYAVHSISCVDLQ